LNWKTLSAQERQEIRRSVRQQLRGGSQIITAERTPTKLSSLKLLRKDGLRVGTIIDVGVQHETRELIEAFPDKKHLLFEPVVENYEQIEKNYSKIDYELIRAAASDEDGEGLLEVHVHPGEAGPQHTSSLIEPHARATHDDMPHLHGYFREVVQRHIAQSKLDTIIRNGAYEKPYLLKLDVDGNELKILQGASETLQHTSCVIIEASLSDLFLRGNYLHSLGFVLWDIVDLGYYCDQLSYVDLVFLSPEERQRAFNPWLTKFDPTKSVRFLH
jgi:FkbM family methyltransferase